MCVSSQKREYDSLEHKLRMMVAVQRSVQLPQESLQVEKEKHRGSAGLRSQELFPEVADEAVSGTARHMAIEAPWLASHSSH